MRIVATHALPELKEVREFVRTQHGAPVRERMKPQFETEHSRLHGELSGTQAVTSWGHGASR